MYRLVLYYLIGILVAAIGLSFFGVLSYNPFLLVFSAVFILAISLVINTIFSTAFKAPTNVESVYITALILALIISPLSSFHDTAYFALAGWASAWAMASKYILTIRKKHIFNPAALAVALTAITISQSASWWVGTLSLLPFVLIGGILMVRKLRRFDLVLSFILVSMAVIVGAHISSGGSFLIVLKQALLYSPILFFACIMLTEPLTAPPTWVLRILYGTIVGVLFLPAIHIGSFYMTPELALLVGNIFSYIVSPKQKLLLRLKSRTKVANDIYDFVFIPDQKPRFSPGQYLEWTLPHRKPDARGNRRYFTVASTPEDTEVYLGVKIYPNGSSFKQALMSLKKGDVVSAGSVAGDFVLPKDKNKKLIFIAGGIGITPYLSMIQHLINHNERREITLFYSNKTTGDIAYADFLDGARNTLGMKVLYALTEEQPSNSYVGKISSDMIQKEVPDWRERIFYLSGPHSMVTAFDSTLKKMGVHKSHIKKDFFPGFA